MAWTTPRTWVPLERPPASTMNTHIRDNLNALYNATIAGQYQAFTPTWANVTLGTTGLVNTGRYFKLGDFLHVEFQLTLGTGGSFGASPPTMSGFPPATAAAFKSCGTAVAMDSASATSRRAVHVYQNSVASSVTFLLADNAAGDQRIAASLPFTWGPSDQLGGSFDLEAA